MAEDTEKTIYLDEVKLFRARTVIGYLLEGGQMLDPVTPMPVVTDDERLVGWASMTTIKSAVVVDVVLSYATPERLDMETGARKLYAWPRYKWARLVEIALRSEPVFDGQPALGEPVLL